MNLSPSCLKFADWLKSQGYGSGSALAKALGVSPTAVSDWAAGKRNPSWPMKLALQILCGADPYGWDVPKAKPPIPQYLEKRVLEYAAQLRAA